MVLRLPIFESKVKGYIFLDVSIFRGVILKSYEYAI